jgi:hypothetical protein
VFVTRLHVQLPKIQIGQSTVFIRIRSTTGSCSLPQDIHRFTLKTAGDQSFRQAAVVPRVSVFKVTGRLEMAYGLFIPAALKQRHAQLVYLIRAAQRMPTAQDFRNAPLFLFNEQLQQRIEIAGISLDGSAEFLFRFERKSLPLQFQAPFVMILRRGAPFKECFSHVSPGMPWSFTSYIAIPMPEIGKTI